MLMIFEFFVHTFLVVLANLLTILSKYMESAMLLVSMLLRALESSLINAYSLSLSLTMVLFLVLMCSLMIGIVIILNS